VKNKYATPKAHATAVPYANTSSRRSDEYSAHII